MPEMEKLTINVNPVDLGQIELLVEQGFYANRAEFIRVAIHSQLAKHADTVKEASVRLAYVIGAVLYDRATLEKAVKANRRIALRVVGFLSLADDITPELAMAAIESVKIHGIFKASKAVRDALADRTS
jgi:Arc/MetJ-type ribon-helix-helix transcriptional regulator